MKRIISATLFALLIALAFAAPATADSGDAVSAACAQRYTVQVGDQLGKIAARYGTTTSALASLNGISNINRIYYGTSLCVKVSSSNGFYYTVQNGDMLSKIAQRYGWSTSYLASVNKISNTNKIYRGQVLFIPNR
ncbi:MAG: LysM peptidoglycan-binding domain-containing protein [Chloroflexi bacterium]|nr:LysM peptidoglycan-binding domain-containing protein [Chloroflexota bacterium]